jgi:type II restriction/modification system DNA methylase subunit YeeA
MKMKTIESSLAPAFRKQKPNRADFELFKKEFNALRSNIDEKETEEFHKNLIINFLNEVYCKGKYFINTKDRIDLVIHHGNSTSSPAGVIIETKSPANKSEMVSHNNFNAKSFQELVLYYLQERKTGGNFELCHLIITNIYEWFIFDAQDFEKLFYQNKTLLHRFEQFSDGKLSGTKTDFFYKEIAAPEIQKLQAEILSSCIHFDIRCCDEKLPDLYKFLHPVNMLKLSVADDSNQLNKEFYNELLHIIGLEEKNQDGKKVIVRKKDNNTGSLIEMAMRQIKSDECKALDDPQYGEELEERAYNAAFRLAIIWVNRILFLKLLEAQILKYHKGDKNYAFLSADKLESYGDLNELFFLVLAVKTEERQPEHLKAKFADVPYLNSSLFEQTDIERNSIYIRALGTISNFAVYPKSVLQNEKAPKSHLEYLLRFLDAYNFSSEGSGEFQEENKPLISASVLGLIFEKINGYKDGSFFTPSFITMYMCRETIGSAVVQKFNEAKGWNCRSIDDLRNHIGKNTEDVKEANQLFNEVRLCDPAVGSGHFLVSALNEMIYLKYKLEILADKNGKRLKNYNVEIKSDELVIADGDNYFAYNPKENESQWVQELLFNEKRTIIENCLFGVDINPNSVEICRLRLWIELLKNAYYRDSGKGEFETLPNIDINIKCGNSLISRFDFYEKYASLDYTQLNKLRDITKEYKKQVFLYKNCTDDRNAKKNIFKRIEEIKKDFSGINDRKDADFLKWEEAENKWKVHINSIRFDGDKVEWEKKLDALQREEERLKKAYQEKMGNVFEWSFEFPEAMNEDGNFAGFDVVIGNPPYIQLQSNSGELAKLYEKCKYQTFARTGDIYCLFYERGYQLLRPRGKLCFITSNKWMRAGYGGNTRKFLSENTNPEQLIDFAGVKVFDEATVDVNILMFSKDKNRQKTMSCIAKKESIKDLGVFVRQYSSVCNFGSGNSWVILSPIEQQIKQKIEKVGTPLKDWDIQINYGIKTGCNEAFIISGEKRKELIKQDPKSDEIIRPILRGRDIKRYGYDFADLWLINTHNGIKEKGITPINVDSYPAIKKHLDKYYAELEKRQDKGDTPYNLRNCAYTDDFYKQKIIYPETTQGANFAFDDGKMFIEKTCFMLISDKARYIQATLSSKLFEIAYKKIFSSIELGINGYQYNKHALIKLPILLPNKKTEQIEKLLLAKKYAEIDKIVYNLYNLTEEEIEFIEKQ